MNITKSNAFNSNKSSKIVYGIDLGTTNSCISWFEPGHGSQTITLKNGKKTMPSCVLWNSNKIGTEDEWVVGDEAYKKRGNSNVCYSVKRLMGSDTKVTFTHAGRQKVLTPQQVSAIILKGLIKQAGNIHKNIHDVVITVPAKFNVKQVKATKEAADIAGLNVLRISKEPTAASLAYHLDKQNGTALIYDLGGGTFDVSIVQFSSTATGSNKLLDILDLDDGNDINQEVVTVKATRGNTKLGGDDLDLYLYEIIKSRLAEMNIDIDKACNYSKERLLLLLEKYKKNISPTIGYNLDVRLDFPDGTKIAEHVPFTYDDFLKCTKKIFNKTKPFIDDVLKAVKLNVNDIVLVGGSTKNEALKMMIREEYPNCTVHDYLNPDESVAIGAGIDASRVAFGNEDLVVYDVIANNIGVLADGKVLPIINQNSTIPVSIMHTFSTVDEDQPSVIIHVYEGNSIFKEECELLGDLEINRVSYKGNGKAAVAVNLSVDTDGLLHCGVEVDGKIHHKDLINVLGRSDSKINSRDEIMFNRWEATIKNLPEDCDVEEGLELLEKAKADPSLKSKVVEFIKAHV